jgi:uroporphyrinogen decarboxylase
MIPARLTGKPFWDVYLYNDPPIWDAYVDACRHFDIDSMTDCPFPLRWPSDPPDEPGWETFIVHRDDERIATQRSRREGDGRAWEPTVTVYYVADPPTANVDPDKLNLPPEPENPEPLEGVREVDLSSEGLRAFKRRMGDQGLVSVSITGSSVIFCVEDIYRLHDDPAWFERFAEQRVRDVERRFADLRAMDADARPDFLRCGGSGSLVFQTPEIFRRYALPAVKRACELGSEHGIPTHVHSCGPQREMVRILAEQTSLTCIDPLEVPPMGDCDLGELKRLYGDKLVLKGNLHTTEVMLRGTADEVRAASRAAIDAAAAGGRFILSTGDQCGRDTPDENLRALVETAHTYGRY